MRYIKCALDAHFRRFQLPDMMLFIVDFFSGEVHILPSKSRILRIIHKHEILLAILSKMNYSIFIHS